MISGAASNVQKTVRGIAVAIRARPRVFAAVSLAVLTLNLFVPPVVLSLARKPWDYVSFNPWVKQLPEYVASSDVPLRQKLEFLPKLAVFWFSANDRHGFPEWGFSVDVSDLGRFAVTSSLFGAYFALWFYHRDPVRACGVGGRAIRNAGVAGSLASVLGLSTGPCSVVGCGAPVLPVVGLVFTGLASGTLKFLTHLSRVATAGILLALFVGVFSLGWRVSAGSPPLPPSSP